jgi:hypothetical protein
VQHARPLVKCSHDAVRHRDVVVREVELRLTARPEVHAVRIGQLDDAATDLELDERRRHVPRLSLNRTYDENVSVRGPTSSGGKPMTVRRTLAMMALLAVTATAAGCGGTSGSTNSHNPAPGSTSSSSGHSSGWG